MDVELSPRERRLYDDVRLAAMADIERGMDAETAQQARFRVLAALTRLRQLACHPKLCDPTSAIPSSKLAVVRDLVTELRDEGHRALIFSQFTRHLALVREALETDGVASRYLDGSMSATAREREVAAFQAGEGDVFLLSLKAGGTGLNLTGADYVLHLDPWWNPAVEDQATDRAHRIGQTRPVTVYRLVSRGTVEDGIVALHAEKRELVEALLAGTERAAALSVSELMALLRGDVADPADVDEESDDPDEPGAGDDDPIDLRPSDVGSEAPAEGDTDWELPTGQTTQGGASQEGALGRLDRALSVAVRQEQVRPVTARSYRRIAERIVAWMAERGHPLTPDALALHLPEYIDDARQGRWRAPMSDQYVARTPGEWLRRALSSDERPTS